MYRHIPEAGRRAKNEHKKDVNRHDIFLGQCLELGSVNAESASS